MSTPSIFPVLMFSPSDFGDAKPGDEQMNSFDEWRFSTLHPEEPRNERAGSIVVSNDGRCWEIVSATAGEIVMSGSWAVRLWRTVFKKHRRRAQQELVELAPMSLGEIKERAVKIIMIEPDYWRFGTALAEDGPPLTEEEVLEDLIPAVREAPSMHAMIEVLNV